MNTKEKVKEAIAAAQKRIADLKAGRQTSDNLERIKQYKDQIAYLTAKLPSLENDSDGDDDLKEYMLKVMGVPAGMQPKDDEQKNDGKQWKIGDNVDLTEEFLKRSGVEGKAGLQTWWKGMKVELKEPSTSGTIKLWKATILENASGCGTCGHSFYSHSQGYDNKWHCQAGCSCTGYVSVVERKNSRGQVGKPLPIRFIEPGLVHYDDVGTVLVTKEVLDRMNASMAGRPIFNRTHEEVSNADFTAGRAHGVAQNDAHFNPEKGWFEVTGLFWDDETLANIRNGYNVSCAYDVKRWGPGGVHNNIPYDREVLEGEYTHLAIVDNPRYERAKIIYNQGGHMKLKLWPFSKDVKPEDVKSSEVELTNATVKVGDKDVQLSDMISSFEATEKARKDAELLNGLSDETMIEVAGKKVSVKDLKNAYAAKLANASDDDEEKKKKAKEDEERKNAEDKEKAEKEKKEKDDMENSQAHKAGSHKSTPIENCSDCKKENVKHFEDLKNAADRREGKFSEPRLQTLQDKVSEGEKRYGPKSA